jgi:putative hydrolase
MSAPVNEDVAARLDEVGRLMASQGADPFRVRAYHRAAEVVRTLNQPVSDILEEQGTEGLRALPGIGESIARAIRDVVSHGRMAMLERLRGEGDPVKILSSVPGIGRGLADRLHHDFGIDSLEDLEAAAHDGRLERLVGIGSKRLAGIRDSLAGRLARVRPAPMELNNGLPPIDEILDVDREYRARARAGELVKIAPRRFNPSRVAWLPILHTERGPRHYTALFSNTARAHALGRTDDWVIIYWDDDGGGERQCTVITAERGPLKGRRIARGRENEQLRRSPTPHQHRYEAA